MVSFDCPASAHPLTIADRRARPRLALGMALTAACLLLATSSASAAETTTSSSRAPEASPEASRLLVLPYASIHGMLPAQIGEKSAQFLQAELGEHADAPGVKLVRLERPAADKATSVNPTPTRNQDVLNQARQSATEAWEALERGDFSLAIARFHLAIELELGQHPYIGFSELVGQYIGLAMASFQLGEEDEGAGYLASAARLDLSHELDPERLPPVFINAFEGIVRQMKGGPRAGLDLDASVSGARVFLDGKEIGTTPLERADLLPGTHFLRVVPTEGAAIWAQPIELVAGQTLKTTARIDLVGGALAEIDRELSQNQLTRSVANRAMALARQVDASHVVLGGVHQEKGGIAVTTYLLSMRNQTVCPLEVILFDAAMLSAGIELYKVGADLLAQLSACKSPLKLPLPVAPDAPTRTAQATFAQPGAIDAFVNYVHTPAKDRRAAPLPEATPISGITDAPRNAELQPPIATASTADAPWRYEDGLAATVKKGEGRQLTWLWITLGVVAAAGLATGGYFLYDAAQNPTGHGTVNWAY
ncbi:MAG: PEGA domain-containing protein [Myxococcales bacterium]|nr:PEGA domain-containing protein [Myxococcales bacterium]